MSKRRPDTNTILPRDNSKDLKLVIDDQNQEA